MALINVTMTGTKELLARIGRVNPYVMSSLETKVTTLTIQLQRHIVENKLSGQVLNVRTGALRRSIQQQVKVSGFMVEGRVYSAGDVKYAAIHEFGGEINMPPRSFQVRLRTNRDGSLMRQSQIDRMGPFTARQAAAMANGAVFAKASHKRAETRDVQHDGYVIHMPERSYMRTGLRDKREDITRGLKSALIEGFTRAGLARR